MNKHTPGPWIHDLELSEGIPGLIVTVNQRCAVANTADTPGWKANARLIAAAPELLEAANAICSGIWSGEGGNVDRLVSRLERAIAKAEGKS